MKRLDGLRKLRLFAFIVSCNGMAGVMLAWLARGQVVLARYAVGLGMCAGFLVPVYVFLAVKLTGRQESARGNEDQTRFYRIALMVALFSLALGFLSGLVITPWF